MHEIPRREGGGGSTIFCLDTNRFLINKLVLYTCVKNFVNKIQPIYVQVIFNKIDIYSKKKEKKNCIRWAFIPTI